MKNRKSPHRPSARGGFTLVELLMVILIIGMLAALLSNAIWAAMRSARETQITVELGQFATSLEEYKNARGEYPPDMRNPGSTAYQALIMRHIRRAWPRYTKTTFNAWRQDVINNTKTASTAGLDPARMRQAEALVFWLGGIWEPNTRTLRGYNANVRAPFSRTPAQYLPAYFKFDETRVLLGRRGWPVYIQPRGKANAPYVYFAAYPGYQNTQYGRNEYVTAGAGTAEPYRLLKEVNGRISVAGFVQAKTFQIVAPGLDGTFGPRTGGNKYYPHGWGYGSGDEDNLASFTKGTLEDAKP